LSYYLLFVVEPQKQLVNIPYGFERDRPETVLHLPIALHHPVVDRILKSLDDKYGIGANRRFAEHVDKLVSKISTITPQTKLIIAPVRPRRKQISFLVVFDDLHRFGTNHSFTPCKRKEALRPLF
jgi:hypothetical protein